MKIELIEEQKLGEEKWYSVYKDGVYVKGSYDIETATKYYNMILNDEGALKPKKIVLMSQEIELPLQQTKS